jgi:hypothetical protein
MSKPNIVEAMSDRRLFEPWFRGRSWDGWKAMLKAAHGIPMQPEEIKLLHISSPIAIHRNGRFANSGSVEAGAWSTSPA